MTDLVVRVARLPRPGETLFGSSFSRGFGGKGSNQAVMAARLGARVSAVVKLGRDSFGDAVLQNYREQGVDTTFVGFAEGEASGVALITVDESSGQNVITIVPGANSTLSQEDVRRAAAAVRGAKVLIAQLETPVAATLEAFRLAKAGGALTLLNPAPAADLPEELLALTDVLIPNELEAAAISGQPVTSSQDALVVAEGFRRQGPETVVITLGGRGAVLVSADGAQSIPAETVPAVDTTGAGDAFVGSLAYFLACAPELPLPEAVTRACRVASLSVQREGAQTSFPHRSEVLDLLE